MQTAPGQAAKNNSNSTAGSSGGKASGRSGVNWMVVALSVFLLALALIIMGASLLGYWPPKSSDESKSIAQQWAASRTATPGTQNANGLTVEKVGTPVHNSDTVTVTLKVTNNVSMPGPDKGTPTPSPNDSPAKPISATVNSGSIRVLFYDEEGGVQKIVGGGYGNVVNLKPGESQTITVVVTPLKNYTPDMKYEAFPDYIWTDKDPVKATPQAGPTNQVTPAKAAPTP